MQIVEEKSLNFDNTIVIKRGKMTGDTEGWLMSDSGSFGVKRDLITGYTYQFDNCYVIKSITKDKSFFDPGDSGSAVFVKEDGKLKPLGIAFAFSADGETYACRIDQIVQAFNLSILDEEEDMETSEKLYSYHFKEEENDMDTLPELDSYRLMGNEAEIGNESVIYERGEFI